MQYVVPDFHLPAPEYETFNNFLITIKILQVELSYESLVATRQVKLNGNTLRNPPKLSSYQLNNEKLTKVSTQSKQQQQISKLKLSKLSQNYKCK